jgi:hypothetical protein
MSKLEVLKKVTTEDGVVKASTHNVLDISANLTLTNVQQNGSHLQGDVNLHVDAGIGAVDVVFPFDIDTGIGNPIDVVLGTVSLPLVGDVEVDAEFSYDLVLDF